MIQRRRMHSLLFAWPFIHVTQAYVCVCVCVCVCSLRALYSCVSISSSFCRSAQTHTECYSLCIRNDLMCERRCLAFQPLSSFHTHRDNACRSHTQSRGPPFVVSRTLTIYSPAISNSSNAWVHAFRWRRSAEMWNAENNVVHMHCNDRFGYCITDIRNLELTFGITLISDCVAPSWFQRPWSAHENRAAHAENTTTRLRSTHMWIECVYFRTCTREHAHTHIMLCAFVLSAPIWRPDKNTRVVSSWMRWDLSCVDWQRVR